MVRRKGDYGSILQLGAGLSLVENRKILPGAEVDGCLPIPDWL